MRDLPRGLVTALLVTALVDPGEAVVPAEGVFVEEGPQDAEAEGAGGEQDEPDAATHLGAGWIVVGEGAEANAGVPHSRRGAGEREEEHVVEDKEDKQCRG